MFNARTGGVAEGDCVGVDPGVKRPEGARLPSGLAMRVGVEDTSFFGYSVAGDEAEVESEEADEE